LPREPLRVFALQDWWLVRVGTASEDVRRPESRGTLAQRYEGLSQPRRKEGGHPVEFANLAHTFEELEQTSSRLALIELLTQLFRSIERPEEIEHVCYLVQGRVAPFFVALEMGMAEKTVARSIAMAYHTTPEHIAALYATLGDLGLVAGQVNNEAGIDPHVLSVEDVFEELRAIAQTAGKGAVEQKIARLAGLLTRARGVSAKYVVRILLGNLRLGIGDATVLDALAKARWNDAKKRKLLEGAYNKTSDLGLIARTRLRTIR
jgi:DNA ligase 1